jgi:hypothetical protein
MNSSETLKDAMIKPNKTGKPTNLFRALFQRSPRNGWKPLPGKRCPLCKGEILFRKCSSMGPADERWDGIETICPICGKDTVDDPLIPDNDNSPEKVAPNSKGWVACPCCGIRFQATDKGAFRDGRHRRCGQALIIQP